MKLKNNRNLTLLAFIVATLIGGNNAIAVRYSNLELPPFLGAAIRFTAASLLLFVIVFFLRLPLPKGRSLLGAIIYGVLQFGISYAFMYWSLLEVPAGLFQIVLSIVPLFTFLFAIAHRQEPFQWRIMIGSLIAVIGIAIVFYNQISINIPLFSLLAIILAAMSIAEAGVLYKDFPKSHPITTNAIGMSVGALILFMGSWLFNENPSLPTLPSTWIAVIYLVVFGSVSMFILVLYVLNHWTASAASYQLVLMPMVTVLVGSLIAEEELTIISIVGGLLVLIGVYIGALMKPSQRHITATSDTA
jgi:drug/metabolite transporter (DMT)-like permease